MNSSMFGLPTRTSAVAFGLLAYGTAAAQDKPAPVQPVQSAAAVSTSATDAQDNSGDIIVTATKRSESLQKVPVSISALTGDQLFNRGVQNLSDLARLVPGVVQTGSAQFSKITVRGIATSNTTSSSGEQKAVAIYLDDFPLTSFSILTPEISPFDMNRIEVLRGPQGTLFGSGTLAGAVKYVTNKPSTHSFDAAFLGDIGLTGNDSVRRRASAMLNVPISSTLAVRAVGYFRDEDGYVTNITLGKKNADSLRAWGGRVALRWQPIDNLTVDAMVVYDRNKLADSNRYTASLGTNIARSRIPYTTNVDLKAYTLSASYDASFATIQSTTTYADVFTDWSLDLNAITAYPYFLREPIKTKSYMEDFKVVSSGKKTIDYVVGFFYLDQKSDYEDFASTDPAFAASRGVTGLITVNGNNNVMDYANRIRKNFEAAVYGETKLNVTDRLSATVGLRQTWYEYSDLLTDRSLVGLAAYGRAVAGTGPKNLVLTPVTPLRISTGALEKLTKKFSVDWHPTPSQNYYVLASEGFRRGHPNAFAGRSVIDPTDPTIIPAAAEADTLWNYEIGAKTRWLNGALQINAALYYIDWGPMQVNLVRGDTRPFVGNAGKSTSKGIELELQVRPVRGLELGANVTVQRARISSLSPQDSLLSGAVLGARLASPEFQIYTYAQKDFALTDRSSLFVRADLQHVGGYPNGFPNRPGTTQPSLTFFNVPAYDNLNLSAGWNTKKLGITVYGENVTNNDTPIFINASTSSTNRFVTLRPRTIGVRVNWKY